MDSSMPSAAAKLGPSGSGSASRRGSRRCASSRLPCPVLDRGAPGGQLDPPLDLVSPGRRSTASSSVVRQRSSSPVDPQRRGHSGPRPGGTWSPAGSRRGADSYQRAAAAGARAPPPRRRPAARRSPPRPPAQPTARRGAHVRGRRPRARPARGARPCAASRHRRARTRRPRGARRVAEGEAPGHRRRAHEVHVQQRVQGRQAVGG